MPLKVSTTGGTNVYSIAVPNKVTVKQDKVADLDFVSDSNSTIARIDSLILKATPQRSRL